MVAHLPYVARLGFDVLYLPPIHPIGREHRKGRNNTEHAVPGDVGQPVGHRRRGGRPHRASTPISARSRTSDALIAAARRPRPGGRARPRLPVRARPPVGAASTRSSSAPAPTAPSSTPRTRPSATRTSTRSTSRARPGASSGTRCSTSSASGSSTACASSASTTRTRSRSPSGSGSSARSRTSAPGVLFLSEAFTRPRVMEHLAKVGFTQSYTYFTWRTSAWELRQYLTELTQTDRRGLLPAELLAEHAGHPPVPPARRAPAHVRDAAGPGGDADRQLRHLRPRVRAAGGPRPGPRARGVPGLREVRAAQLGPRPRRLAGRAHRARQRHPARAPGAAARPHPALPRDRQRRAARVHQAPSATTWS